MRKHTIEFVRGEFEKEGYQLLSTIYVNNKTLLEYICPKGHYGNIRFNGWINGNRCPICTGVKKKTIEFVRKEFEKEGYQLLSTVYINSRQKLEYICPKGHRGNISWASWAQGHRCLVCGIISSANKYRLSIEFIREQFAKKSYILLTKKYINCKQKLEYICPKGHRGSISWNNWKTGHRCPICTSVKPTIEFIRNAFEKEDYRLLSKKYVNDQQKLECICSKNHHCFITWSTWKRGCRCRKCWIESIKGEKNIHWNKNLTDEDRQDHRNTPEYREWAYNVKKRDNFTCAICGDNRGGNLVSHHLYSYSSYPELQLAENNGICLCEPCHKLFHHIFGYGNNTRAQFEEFKRILAAEKKNLIIFTYQTSSR